MYEAIYILVTEGKFRNLREFRVAVGDVDVIYGDVNNFTGTYNIIPKEVLKFFGKSPVYNTEAESLLAAESVAKSPAGTNAIGTRFVRGIEQYCWAPFVAGRPFVAGLPN